MLPDAMTGGNKVMLGGVYLELSGLQEKMKELRVLCTAHTTKVPK